MRETIVVGDLHGCKDEFNELLDRINYSKTRHRVVLTGDLLDRGSDPVGLIHQVRAMELETVLSNHEIKAWRWRKFEERRELTGEPNPVKDPSPKRKAEWLALNDEDLNWIGSLPYTIHLGNKWNIVHGGVEFARPFDQQLQENVIRIRVVDKDGVFVKIRNGQERPLGTDFWASVWNQEHNIIFGHTVFKKPKVFKNKNNTCIGVDTGVVYGGHLTGYNIDTDQFIQVKARKKYYSPA